VHNADLVTDPFAWFEGAAGPNKLIFEFHTLPWKKNFSLSDWVKCGKLEIIKFGPLCVNDMKAIALHCNLTPSSDILSCGDATRMCVALKMHNGAKDRSYTAMSETEAIVRGAKTDIDCDMTPYVIHEHSWQFIHEESWERAAQLSENLAYADALNPSTQYDQVGKASLHSAHFLGLATAHYANLRPRHLDLSGPLRSMKAQPVPNLKHALMHLSLPFKVILEDSDEGPKYFREGKPAITGVAGAPAITDVGCASVG
jgi:hypothetical protein